MIKNQALNKQMLKRVTAFIEKEEIPITLLCRKTRISPQLYYLWRSGKRFLSDNVLSRFDSYLSHLNY